MRYLMLAHIRRFVLKRVPLEKSEHTGGRWSNRSTVAGQNRRILYVANGSWQMADEVAEIIDDRQTGQAHFPSIGRENKGEGEAPAEP